MHEVMRSAYRLPGLALVVGLFASACAASVQATYSVIPDPIVLAVAEHVSTNDFRGHSPVEEDVAMCIATRVVGRIDPEHLAEAGLGTRDDAAAFFTASIVWPADVGSVVDRVIAGCTDTLSVQRIGGDIGRDVSNARMALTAGEEFCLGEFVVAQSLDPADPAMIDALDACLGFGRTLLASFDPSQTLRPASVECLQQRETDLRYADLVRINAGNGQAGDAEIFDASITYLDSCLTNEELVMVVEG